jgi:hypothetical protein
MKSLSRDAPVVLDVGDKPVRRNHKFDFPGETATARPGAAAGRYGNGKLSMASAAP